MSNKINIDRLEALLEAGCERDEQSLRFARAYGRATVYLEFILKELPADRFAYWLDRMQHTAETRKREAMTEAQEAALAKQEAQDAH